MASGKSEAGGSKGIFHLSPIATLHFFALFTLAVSHPLYAVLGQADHTPFFVAHQSRGIDIAVFVLILSFLFPALICLGLWLLRLLSNMIASVLFLALMFLLFFAAWLPVPDKWIAEPGALAIILPLVIAGIGILLYIFTAWARSFVTILSLAIIFSPIMFFSMPSMQSFMATPQAQDFSVRVSSAVQPNIVMIIFDELPLMSLLDEKHEIDSVRYPNFRRLAETSNWYRNTITNHYATTGAIASLLVGDEFSKYFLRVRGNAPIQSAILDRTNAPQNLFTLLENHYDIAAIESTSKLALENESALKFAPPLLDRIYMLLADAFVLYAHVLVPDTLRHRLPVIEGQWKGYLGTHLRPPTRLNERFPGNAAVVKQLIDQLHPTEKPTLFYLHVLLPHFPFVYTDQGVRHTNKFKFLTEHLREATGSNNWPNETVANLVWQAHLMQVSFIDLLLGRVLDRLNDLGMYDETLLIVTADHGLSFFWNSGDISSEKMSLIQASETLHVPLFVKLPWQDKAQLSESPIQTIDIVPTIADILDLDIPWETGGISVFSQIPENRMRNANIPDRRTFGPVIDPDHQALNRKVQTFGTGSIEKLYLSGPYREIVGKPVTAFPAGGSIGTVRIDREEQYAGTAPVPGRLPGYVEGEIFFEPGFPYIETHSLAISVNGIIRNTTNTTGMKISTLRVKKNGEIYDDTIQTTGDGANEEARRVYFLARLPMESLVTGKNEVSLYAIVENENDPVLSLYSLEKYGSGE